MSEPEFVAATERAAQALLEEAIVCGKLVNALRAQAAARRRYAAACRDAALVERQSFRIAMWSNERTVALREAQLLEHEANARELRRHRLETHALLLGSRLR